MYIIAVTGVPAKWVRVFDDTGNEILFTSYESIGAFLRNWDNIRHE